MVPSILNHSLVKFSGITKSFLPFPTRQIKYAAPTACSSLVMGGSFLTSCLNFCFCFLCFLCFPTFILSFLNIVGLLTYAQCNSYQESCSTDNNCCWYHIVTYILTDSFPFIMVAMFSGFSRLPV